ncbi:acyl carrier protein [Crossiella sp. CA198]|uniref:acyl carrier protein n=1 Tax=Crossiella sp. CA198 TaxID=3455607 RepID=UPI003F8D2E01
MSTEQTAEIVAAELTAHLAATLKTTVAPDHDLFASGLVSSMFAMQLVVHLEGTYGVAIVGGDLKLDNFRTVDRMTGLVLRLRQAEPVSDRA